MDCAGNKKAQRVSFEEAANWNYKVSNDDVHALLSYLKEQIAEGDLDTSQLSQIARGITRLDEFGEENLRLARDIERQISEKKQ